MSGYAALNAPRRCTSHVFAKDAVVVTGADDAPVRPVHVRPCGLDFVEAAGELVEQRAARASQLEFAAGALEQPHGEAILEIADMLADGARRNAELVGRLFHAAAARHFDERVQRCEGNDLAIRGYAAERRR